MTEVGGGTVEGTQRLPHPLQQSSSTFTCSNFFPLRRIGRLPCWQLGQVPEQPGSKGGRCPVQLSVRMGIRYSLTTPGLVGNRIFWEEERSPPSSFQGFLSFYLYPFLGLGNQLKEITLASDGIERSLPISGSPHLQNKEVGPGQW